MLEAAGCSYVRRTPASHDQGIDAFGHATYFHCKKGKWHAAEPKITFLAQAKHYRQCQVGTKDIRDLVGSYDLALHKVFSTVDIRYKELDLLPFAPVGLVFLTSEEIPLPVKRLASRAGIVVLSSDDLYDVLLSITKSPSTSITKDWLLKTWATKIAAIPIAK